MKRILLSALIIGLIFFSGCANNQTKTGNESETTGETVYDINLYYHPDVGELLTDKEGMTLYITTRDEAYKSNCYGSCEINWVPFYMEGAINVSPEIADEIETILRDTGKKQLAYRGMPLYTYKGDSAPGDITGHGVNGVWLIASTAPLAPQKPVVEEETTTTTEAHSTTTTATTQEPTTTIAPLSGVVKIDISGFSFNPAEITITKDSTVVWTNNDNSPHTITSDFGDELDSDTFTRGQTYSHVFSTPGTYSYHCKFHGGMKGTVTVV